MSLPVLPPSRRTYTGFGGAVNPDGARAVTGQRPCFPCKAATSGPLELTGEAARAPARPLALVEAVCVEPVASAVELEMGGTPLPRPVLGGIEQRLPHPL